jgi:ribonuclease E
MEQNSHVRKVEKAMKEALKNDRARIQVGRISSFGLMEMSRQRLRTGVLEASTKPCPHCDGTGLMRTAASAGLSALRIIEDEAARGRGERICLRAGKEAAVYVLNKKRSELADIEQRYGVMIDVIIDESFEGARMTVESSGPRPVAAPRLQAPIIEDEDDSEVDVIDDEAEDEDERGEPRDVEDDGDQQARRRRRRRRGGRGRNRRDGGEEGETREAGEAIAIEAVEESVGDDTRPASEELAAQEPREGGRRRRRRRGRGGANAESTQTEVEPDSSPMVERPIDEEPPIAATEPAEEPKPAAKRTRRKKAVSDAGELQPEAAAPEVGPPEAAPLETADEPASDAKPARKRRSKKADAEATAETPAAAPIPVPPANNDTAEEGDDGEPRRGWWQRTFG